MIAVYPQIMFNIGICLLVWIFCFYSLHLTFSYQTELSKQVSAYCCVLFYLYGSHTLMVLTTANMLMSDGKKASDFIHKILLRIRHDEVKKRVSFMYLVQTNFIVKLSQICGQYYQKRGTMNCRFFQSRSFALEIVIKLPSLPVNVFFTATSTSFSCRFMWIFFDRLAYFIFGLFAFII